MSSDAFQPNEALLTNLFDMGFSKKLSVEALFIANNDFEQAVNFCLAHGSDPEYADLEESDGEDTETDGEEIEDLKMILVVRTDLKMGKGKICAQCAHAAVDGYRRIIQGSNVLHQKWLSQWEDIAEAKVAVKVQSEADLIQLQMKAMIADVPNALIIDAGRTQVEPGTKTVLSLGPAPCSVLDKITGKLKLL